MPLPPDVEEARERMERADAALRADVESNEPYNSERRHRLLDELKGALDAYVEKMAALARSIGKGGPESGR